MITKVNIKEPYWSAGTKYHWAGARTGLGIRKDLCLGEGYIETTIGKEKDITYTIKKHTARALVNQFHSFYNAGKSIIAVIPLWAFEVKQIGKVISQKKVEEAKQLKLIK